MIKLRIPKSFKNIIYGLTKKAGGILYEKMLFAEREKLPEFE